MLGRVCRFWKALPGDLCSFNVVGAMSWHFEAIQTGGLFVLGVAALEIFIACKPLLHTPDSHSREKGKMRKEWKNALSLLRRCSDKG